MIRLLRVSALVLSLTLYGFSQVAAVDKSASGPSSDSIVATLKTAGSWNGRFWRSLNISEKTAFLTGYADAFDRASTLAAKDYQQYLQMFKTFWPSSLTVDEVRIAVDKLYETPENGPIPIGQTLFVVSTKADGADDLKIQETVSKLRANASQQRSSERASRK